MGARGVVLLASACFLLAAACSRALDGPGAATVLVLAPPPASAAPPVQIVPENGEDPSLAAWGSYATFEDVARATEEDAGTGHELSFDSLLEPLSDDGLLTACQPASETHLRARVAVLKGHAIGVTVEVDPDDPELAHCIDRRIRALAWEPSDRVQFVVKTW